MNHPSSTDTSYSSPGSDAVSRRAYEIWEREGRPDGNDLRHWLQAEQELNQPVNSPREERTSQAANTDVRPLQGTRAGAAASREPKRGSNPPFSGEKSAVGNGSSQTAARRKPASAPPM